jgi:hypothetical protein
MEVGQGVISRYSPPLSLIFCFLSLAFAARMAVSVSM